MSKKILLGLVFVVVMSILSAFEGKREGFLMGFGIGISQVHYKTQIDDYTGTYKSVPEASGGLATEINLGMDFQTE